MAYNPLERASIALSQIGLEAREHGMPDVQRGLDCLSAHLGLRAGDADEQIAEGMPAPIVMTHALHEAVVGAVTCTHVGAPVPRPWRTWLVRLSLAAAGVDVMWWEGSVQPSPGVGFVFGMALILGSALFSDREPG